MDRSFITGSWNVNLQKAIDSREKEIRVSPEEEPANKVYNPYFWHKRQQPVPELVEEKKEDKLIEFDPAVSEDVQQRAMEMVTVKGEELRRAQAFPWEFYKNKQGVIFGESNLTRAEYEVSKFYAGIQDMSLLFASALPDIESEAGIAEDDSGFWRRVGGTFGMVSDIAVAESLYSAVGLSKFLYPKESTVQTNTAKKVAMRVFKDKSPKTQQFMAKQLDSISRSMFFGAEAGLFASGFNYVDKGQVDNNLIASSTALGFVLPYALPMFLTKMYGGMSGASKTKAKGAIAKGIFEVAGDYADLDVVKATPDQLANLSEEAFKSIARHLDDTDVSRLTKQSLKDRLASIQRYIVEGRNYDEIIDALSAQMDDLAGGGAPMVCAFEDAGDTALELGGKRVAKIPSDKANIDAIKKGLNDIATEQQILRDVSESLPTKLNRALGKVKSVIGKVDRGTLTPIEANSLTRQIGLTLGKDSSLLNNRKSLKTLVSAVRDGDVKAIRKAVNGVRKHKTMANTLESDKLLSTHKKHQTPQKHSYGDIVHAGKMGVDGFNPVFDFMKHLRSKKFDRKTAQVMLSDFDPSSIKETLKQTGHTIDADHPLGIALDSVIGDLDELKRVVGSAPTEELTQKANSLARRINGMEEALFETQAVVNDMVTKTLKTSGAEDVLTKAIQGKQAKIKSPMSKAGKRIFNTFETLFGKDNPMTRIAAKIQLTGADKKATFVRTAVEDIYSNFAEKHQISLKLKSKLADPIKSANPVTGKVLEASPEEIISLRATLGDSHVQDTILNNPEFKRLQFNISGAVLDPADLKTYVKGVKDIESGVLRGEELTKTMQSVRDTDTFRLLSMGLEDEVLDDMGMTIFDILDDTSKLTTEGAKKKYGKEAAYQIQALALSKRAVNDFWRPTRDMLAPHTQQVTRQITGLSLDRMPDMYPIHTSIEPTTSKAAGEATALYKSLFFPRIGYVDTLNVNPFFAETQRFTETCSSLAAYGVDAHRLSIALRAKDIKSYVQKKGLGDVYQNALNIVDYINKAGGGIDTLTPGLAKEAAKIRARIGLYGRPSAALAQHGSFNNAMSILDPKYHDADVHTTLYTGNKKLYQDLMDDIPQVWTRGQGKFSWATASAKGQHDIYSAAYHGAKHPTSWAQGLIVNRDKTTLTALYQAARKQVAGEFGLSFAQTKGHKRTKELMSQVLQTQPNFTLSGTNSFSIHAQTNAYARVAFMFMSPTVSMMDTLSMARLRYKTGEISGTDYGRSVAAYVSGLVHTAMLKQTARNLTYALAVGQSKLADTTDIDKEIGKPVMPRELDSPEEVYKRIGEFSAKAAVELVPYVGRATTAIYQGERWRRDPGGSPFAPFIEPFEDVGKLLRKAFSEAGEDGKVKEALQETLGEDLGEEELRSIMKDLDDAEARESYIKWMNAAARASDLYFKAGITGILDTVTGGLRTPETDAAIMVGLMDGTKKNYSGMTAMKIDAIHSMPSITGDHTGIKQAESYSKEFKDSVRWIGGELRSAKSLTQRILQSKIESDYIGIIKGQEPFPQLGLTDNLHPSAPLTHDANGVTLGKPKANEPLLEMWDRLESEWDDADTKEQKVITSYRMRVANDQMQKIVDETEKLLIQSAAIYHSAKSTDEAEEAERVVSETLDILFEQFPPSTLDKYAE